MNVQFELRWTALDGLNGLMQDGGSGPACMRVDMNVSCCVVQHRCHGVSQDFTLRSDLVDFAKRHNVVFVFLPHHTSHRLQPNDQLVHLLVKAGLVHILKAILECWANRNRYICRQALKQGEVQIIACTDGVGDQPARDPSLSAPQYRVANFHLGKASASRNVQPNQRDYIVAALWSWKHSVTPEAVVESWAVTGLFPFDPDAHKKYTEVSEKVDTKLSEAEAKRSVDFQVRLESASAVFTTTPTGPEAAADPPGIQSKRVARLRREADNDTRANAFFDALFDDRSIKLVTGVDRLRIIRERIGTYLNRIDAGDERKALVRGDVYVRYAPRTPSTFDEDLAAAERKKAGRGLSAGLMNAAPGKNRSGLVFDGRDVEVQQAQHAMSSESNIRALRKRRNQAQAGKSKADDKKKTSAASKRKAQKESNGAQKRLALAEEATMTPVPEVTLAFDTDAVASGSRRKASDESESARKHSRGAAQALNRAIVANTRATERAKRATTKLKEASKNLRHAESLRNVRKKRLHGAL